MPDLCVGFSGGAWADAKGLCGHFRLSNERRTRDIESAARQQAPERKKALCFGAFSMPKNILKYCVICIDILRNM